MNAVDRMADRAAGLLVKAGATGLLAMTAIIMASGVAVNEVDPAPFAEAMTGMWEANLTTPRQRALVEQILSQRGARR